jgi:hypothetical protein
VHKRIVSAVKRVESVSDRMPNIILRGRWCHIIVLNVHAPTEDNTDGVKASFYKERVFDKFDRLCVLVVRVPGCRSRGPGSIPGATRFSEKWVWNGGPLSFVSTIEDLLEIKSSSSSLKIRESG